MVQLLTHPVHYN